MQILLNPQSEAIVKKLQERGYGDPLEIIEKALQQMDEAANLAWLRAEIQQGIDSGESEPLDMQAIKAKARQQWEQQRQVS